MSRLKTGYTGPSQTTYLTDIEARRTLSRLALNSFTFPSPPSHHRPLKPGEWLCCRRILRKDMDRCPMCEREKPSAA